jgi:hypothetical protein
VKTWIGVALVCLLLPMQVVATNTQVAMCRRGHLNFYFGPISAEVGDHTIT